MATPPWPFDSIKCYNTLMSIDINNINKPNYDTSTFHYLTHEQLRYGGFAIDVQNANHPRIINRPQMDSLWLRQLVASFESDSKTGLHVPTNPKAEQAIVDMVKRALYQACDSYANQYWAIIALKHSGVNTSCIERPEKESEIKQKKSTMKRGKQPVRKPALKVSHGNYDSYRPYDNQGRHRTWHKHERRRRIYRNGEGLLEQKVSKHEQPRKNKYAPPKKVKTKVKLEENRDVRVKLEDNGEQAMATYRTRMQMPQEAENMNEGQLTLVMR